MRLFDKVKVLFNKVSGAPRAWFATDGYEAATYSRDRSFLLTPDTDSMTNPSSFTRQEISRLSRYLINNVPVAERIASLCEIYGVGAGISANAATTDAAFNAEATKQFGIWADSSFASSDHEANFYDMQRIIARELLIAGEVFAILSNTAKGYPQVMLVKSEHVENSGETGDDSVDGIFFDDYGRATAYMVKVGAGYQKFDASNVVHIKRVKNVGAKRGVGYFSSSCNALRDHRDMLVLIKKALKIQLTTAAFVKKNTLGAGAGLGNDIFPVDGNILPTTQATNRGLERIYGANVVYGLEGEEIDLLATEHPSENVAAFLEKLLRDVCLSVSLPYDFVISAEKLAGTGVRFAINDASFFFSGLQNIMIDGGLNRIYHYVISCLIKAKTLAPPANGELPSGVSWTRPISLTVDQGRMSVADIASLEAGLTTRELFYSARGLDWKKCADQWISEAVYLKEQADKNGIPLSLVFTPGKTPIEPGALTSSND